MSSPSDFDSREYVLDMLINLLKEHEQSLCQIVERFESILGKASFSGKDGNSLSEPAKSQPILGMGEGEEGVIFISGKRILLIPEEELPKILRSGLVKLVEYEVDTPEKRNVLEELFSMLKKRKKKTEK